MRTTLTPSRRVRVFTVGLSAAVSLYFLAALVAEPLRTFAQDSETVIVQVTIGEAIGLSCDGDNNGSVGSGETLSLGTIIYTGDTSAYSPSRAAHCRVHTNSLQGYTISWLVASGSGGMSTGYLISQYEHTIAPFGTGSASSNFTKLWQLTPAGNLDDARWGGRVSSTSSGVAINLMDFGTDGSDASEKWARVATGTAVPIRTSTGPSQGGILGDIIRVGFRVQVGSNHVQETGVYRATVTFTASINT